MEAKKARGERTGSVPYGYRLAADGVHLEAVPEVQALIAVVRRFPGAGLSLRAISHELATSGFLSRTKKPFLAQQIRRMLSNAPDVPEA